MAETAACAPADAPLAIVNDHRSTRLEGVKSSTIKELADGLKHFASLRRNLTYICIAPTDLAYGLSRMFQTHLETAGIPWKTHVVRTVDQCGEIISGLTKLFPSKSDSAV